ncbi:GxxExxY protein [Chlamydiota bacterium]
MVKLLHKDLSYIIRGIAFEIRKTYGLGHKERLYQKAFAEELDFRKVNYEKEKSIKIISPKTRKLIGAYRPDFIVEDKIIIELKSLNNIPEGMIDQLYSYLRNSKYELGFFINFCSEGVDITRIIYTNDKKYVDRI